MSHLLICVKNFCYNLLSLTFWEKFQPLSNALLKGGKLQKILITLKNVLNESCLGLNFLKKTQWKHIIIYLRSGARGSKDLHVRNIIMHWNEIVYGWSLQKIQIILKNALYKNCAELNFLQKTPLTHIFPSSPGVELGGSKDLCFWNIIMHWSENVLKIFLKMHRIASYSKNFSHWSKDMTLFVSDLLVFVNC